MQDKESLQQFDVAVGREFGEYTLKPAKFPNVSTITLFFPASQVQRQLGLLYRIPWPMERGGASILFCTFAVPYCIVLLTILFRSRDSASRTLLLQFTSLRPTLPTMRRYRVRMATSTCHRIEHPLVDGCKG
ncbi:hypothetical protein BGY98DRAFT_702963 [Russula aff. rugulosa BPL654]|nr:hypothetical protein BGY98DRAFT_702963 [Russula aff. rugulosa BPL654]